MLNLAHRLRGSLARLHPGRRRMERAVLSVALDRAVDDLVLRERSVEQCLARWPHRRDELEPLMRAAEALVAARSPRLDAPPARERRIEGSPLPFLREQLPESCSA